MKTITYKLLIASAFGLIFGVVLYITYQMGRNKSVYDTMLIFQCGWIHGCKAGMVETTHEGMMIQWVHDSTDFENYYVFEK